MDLDRARFLMGQSSSSLTTTWNQEGEDFGIIQYDRIRQLLIPPHRATETSSHVEQSSAIEGDSDVAELSKG